MLAHLRAVLPQEGCGLLSGAGGRIAGVYPIDNILRSPVSYEMDPRQQIEAMLAIEAAGLEMAAFYHSHPTGPDEPSETDIERAYYPDVRQLIVSLADPERPIARAFWVVAGVVQAIPLRVL